LQRADALDRICRKLHLQLARIIGELGVRLILVRAIKITRAEFPFLAVDPALEDGECLRGLRESLQGQDPAMVSEALTSLLANLLEVLLSLLGKNLIYALLRDSWPEVKAP
jgi:hypothetical protein